MAHELWVFAYGSLIWDPGFDVAESRIATVSDWHRSFCMWSIHFRGTPQSPGLVLALDAKAGAQCRGVALRVVPGQEAPTLVALRARELISSAYTETILPVALSDGRRIDAVTYTINQEHAQYCGVLSIEQQARIIATSKGQRGDNCDYLYVTATHLAKLGIADPELDDLTRRVTELRG